MICHIRTRNPIFGVGISLSLLLVFTACSFTDLPPATPTRITPPTLMPTPTQVEATPLANSPTATPSPTLLPTPTAAPPTPTPITQQGDRFLQSSTGDTIRSTITPVLSVDHSNILTIECEVVDNGLNLREGPDATFNPITTLSSGTILSARKCSPAADWLLVETSDQMIGWVSANFIACQRDPIILPTANGLRPAPRPTSTSTVVPTSTPLPIVTNVESPLMPGLISQDYWQGEYYDNPSLLNEPVLVRQDAELNFDWILDSPAPEIPADDFSVRWTRVFDFIESGDYRFYAEADDGIRLYIDGWQIIDAWGTGPATTRIGDFADIQKGLHTVTVEYFESGGHARIKVWGERRDIPSTGWQGEYYDNEDLRDPTAFIRQHDTLDFDWGDSSPGDGLGGNNFSVRWTGEFYFLQDDYRFYATIADRDRVKIYLDGWLILDEYAEEEKTVEGFFDNVGAGNHTVVVEYQENVGEAKIKVGWEQD